MRRAALLAVLLTTACTTAAPAPADLAEGIPVPDDAQEAVVVRVSDGDTLRLRGRGSGPLRGGDDERVRVLLVDTPEVFDSPECFGEEAAERSAALLPEGSTVRVQADEDPRDRFDRLLLHVWNADGVNVGEALVAEGYARVQVVQPNERYLDVLAARQAEAQDAGRGLWGAC